MSSTKKHKFALKEVAADCNDGESDDEDEVGEFQIVSEENDLKLTNNFHPFIQKVRTIVKIFRK